MTLRGLAASIRSGAALSLLVLGACSGARPAPPSAPWKPLRAATLEEVLSAYDAYCEAGKTLSASGDLELRDRRTGKGRSLGVRLVAARDGRLYLSVARAAPTRFSP